MYKFLPALALVLGISAVQADPARIMPSEWDEFRFERLAVLKANPELVKEEAELDAELDAQKARVDAAAVRIDAEVSPILDKLSQALKADWGKTAGVLSVTDWQKLRAARTAALKADPSLAAANEELLAKKKAFEVRVDAALLKTDSGVEHFLNR